MKRSRPCCLYPESVSRGSRPFSRIIALGFYDGPTSGILQCEACGNVFKFDMLDWDEHHDVRVFRLAELPLGSLEKAIKLLPPDERAQLPMWVPLSPNHLSEEAQKQLHKQMEDILARAKPAELLVAWQNSTQTALAAKRFPVKRLAGIHDWFSSEDSSDQLDWLSLVGQGNSNDLVDRPA